MSLCLEKNGRNQLEMDKNDQLEVIKYSPHFTPHLSDAALDGLRITVYPSPFFLGLNGWVKHQIRGRIQSAKAAC